MVNFIPESRLLFIESVPFTEILSRQSLKLFLKMGLKKMEQEFPFGPFRPGQPDFLSCRKFRCYRKFYIGTTRKLFVYIHFNRNFWVCWKMKAPVYMISPFSSSHRPPRGGYYLILIVQKTSKTFWRGEYFTRLRLHIEKVAYNRSLYVVACELVINKIMLTLVFVVIVVFYTECIV